MIVQHSAPLLENPQSVRQQGHPALLLIAARADLFIRQGSIAQTWRYRAGERFGPYCQLMYREGGRQRSVYLGRPGPLVDQVNRALAQLQGPSRRKRSFERLRREAVAAMRVHKTRLDAILRASGLRMQGFEVRGWHSLK